MFTSVHNSVMGMGAGQIDKYKYFTYFFYYDSIDSKVILVALKVIS